ncbi:MAG: dihydrofolate reductase [Pleopsidium flavum]|nr:MAG: dihydrofolate reductase [Pleopsidium flavum]
MTTFPADMPPPTLTLIVAATAQNMGIGRGGTLPWTGLKKEMAYFARVTKRPPTQPLASSNSMADDKQKSYINAVIMGRKTWESIPTNFRPLKERVNVVVSRKAEKVRPTQGDGTEVYGVRSIQEGLRVLQKEYDGQGQSQRCLGKVFVIGGAEMYQAALEMEETKRVLLTRIRTAFECDTFFPVDLDGGQGWVRRGKEELDGFVGERVPEGLQVENGVEYGFEMYERG